MSIFERENTRFVLDNLAKSGSFLFHGTTLPHLTELKPNQAINFGEPDGVPAVTASDMVEPAIFMALFRDGYYSAMGIRPTVENTLGLTIAESALDRLMAAQATATVYVLDRKGFQHHKGYEWRSANPVTPLAMFNVAIHQLNTTPRVVRDSDIQEYVESSRVGSSKLSR